MPRPRTNPAAPGPLTPTELVLHRIRMIREAQGLSISALAKRLLENGYVISDNRLWNLESGRSRLHVDTLFAIATALGVSPLALQTMPTDGDEEMQPAPGVRVSAARFNAWVSGTSPLPGSSKETFAAHHPYGPQLSRFRGDLDERAQALALRLASHADETAAAAEVLRDQALAYATTLLEGKPSEDILRSAEALSKRLGIDMENINDQSDRSQS